VSVDQNSNSPIIGIIMLNTAFPRPKGDVGNLASYDYPAIILKLSKANVANVVSDSLSDDVIQEVIAGAHELRRQGVKIITTSCGFLAPIQQQVQQSVGLPFIASSLCLLPFLRQVFGSKSKIAILTFDSQVLSPDHFNGNFDDQLVIDGIEKGQELHQVIKHGLLLLDEAKAQQDVLEATQRLMHHAPACILLECTNLSPYKAAIRKRFGIAVYDLVDAVHWLAKAY